MRSHYTVSRTIGSNVVRIEVEIETSSIEDLLFDQVLRNRTGRTRLLSGLIKAKLLKKESL